MSWEYTTKIRSWLKNEGLSYWGPVIDWYDEEMED